MGEHIAPSPQKGRGRKSKKSPRRKKAAPRAANGQPVSSNGAARVRSAAKVHTTGGTVHAAIPETAGQGKSIDFRRNWFERTAYAALDLGTNNCRLLIAKVGGDDFTVVDAFSRVVRLGEGLTTTGRMSDEAMDRAVEALSVCAEKLKKAQRRAGAFGRDRSLPSSAERS